MIIMIIMIIIMIIIDVRSPRILRECSSVSVGTLTINIGVRTKTMYPPMVMSSSSGVSLCKVG